MANAAIAGGNHRLAVIGPSARQIARLRGALVSDCLQRGVRVLALAPDMGAAAAGGLIASGVEAEVLQLPQKRFSLTASRRARHALVEQISAWQTSAVLAFGAHVAPMAISAARKARVGRVVLLVSEIRDRALDRKMVAAIRMADVVVVHNAEDRLLVLAAAEGSAAKVIVVAGAGTDVSSSGPIPLPPADGPLVFAAAARLDTVKGTLDYLDAARMAAQKGITARFLLAGSEGLESDAIKADILARYADAVQYVGDKDDLRAFLAEAHVFVSASRCEGMPHAVLQALAAGRPIIATNIIGTRDTVDEMVNGTLVAPGQPAQLVEAFERLVRNKALLGAMARASRAKAERRFSQAEVNAALLLALQFQ